MLKRLLQHFTLAEETTRNEHYSILQNDMSHCYSNLQLFENRHPYPLTDHATQPGILAAFHFHQSTKKAASTATLYD